MDNSKGKKNNKIKTSFLPNEIPSKEKAIHIPRAKGTNSLIKGYLNQEIILRHKFWIHDAR